MTFDGSQIPQALRNLNQWLCWQKPAKTPINPHTGRNTSATAAVWSYEECITAAAGHGYGIGFSLKNGIFGVDLDHVLDEKGQLKKSLLLHLEESYACKISSLHSMNSKAMKFFLREIYKIIAGCTSTCMTSTVRRWIKR